MFTVRFLKRFTPPNRQLNTTSVRRNIPAGGEQPPKPAINEPLKPTTNEQATKASKSNVDMSVLANIHYVSNFDKRVLVWVKKYPTIDAIPKAIPWSTMQRANTIARIRICNILGVIAIIGFISAVVSGKREAAAGRHVIGDRMKWYEEMKQKGIEEAESKRKHDEETAALAAAK